MIHLYVSYRGADGWILSIFHDKTNRKMAVFQYEHGGMVIVPVRDLKLAED